MISRSMASVKIVLAHRSKNSKVDGKQSIQLRIIYNRKPKYYSLGYSVYENEFQKMYNGQVREGLHDLKIKLQEIELKATEIVRGLDPFSFTQFETRLFRPRSDQNNVYAYIQSEIVKAQEARKISSKVVAECSLNLFTAFEKKNNLVLGIFLYQYS